MIREIHLTGLFSVPEIIHFNRTHLADASFDTFFPFWKILPDIVVRAAGEVPPSREAMLVVINLNDMVWDQVRGSLSSFGKTVLIQTEARINYEAAYQHAEKFDAFVNFDPTYASHPGFFQAYVPYIPYQANSKRDLRGSRALRKQWSYSRRVFLDTYLLRFLPRHRKACLIITLHAQEHYQVRLRVARKWTDQVDVFGGAWPSDLPSWRGMCGDKIAVARRYRYALVMENQRQPGYVTEKLLDAVAAGCIPIYWGAPDAGKLPGAEAFIPFADEDFPVGKVIQSGENYNDRKKILLSNRKALFHVFSREKYVEILTRAIKG
jgi:hypothetical protein